jgi:membrane protein insertase Oxa1/YidC/SpoIIIJ
MLRSGMKSLTCIANTKSVSLNNLKAFRYKNCTLATNIRSFSVAPDVNRIIATSAQTGIPDTSTIIQVPDVPLVNNSAVDAITTIDASAIIGSFYPSHIVMQLVDGIHTFTGIPYWEAIIALTVGIRIVLGPLAIKSVQNAARMGAVRPVMQKVTEANAKNPNKDDARVQLLFNNEVKQLWKTYKVNPLSAMAMPLAQIPVFLFLFSGLRDMGNHYGGLHTGGAYWFTDLTMADPYFIFPVVNACVCLISKIKRVLCIIRICRCHIIRIMKFSRITQVAVLIWYISQEILQYSLIQILNKHT